MIWEKTTLWELPPDFFSAPQLMLPIKRFDRLATHRTDLPRSVIQICFWSLRSCHCHWLWLGPPPYTIWLELSRNPLFLSLFECRSCSRNACLVTPLDLETAWTLFWGGDLWPWDLQTHTHHPELTGTHSWDGEWEGRETMCRQAAFVVGGRRLEVKKEQRQTKMVKTRKVRAITTFYYLWKKNVSLACLVNCLCEVMTIYTSWWRVDELVSLWNLLQRVLWKHQVLKLLHTHPH